MPRFEPPTPEIDPCNFNYKLARPQYASGEKKADTLGIIRKKSRRILLSPSSGRFKMLRSQLDRTEQRCNVDSQGSANRDKLIVCNVASSVLDSHYRPPIEINAERRQPSCEVILRNRWIHF
jgi:hypothetical protein